MMMRFTSIVRLLWIPLLLLSISCKREPSRPSEDEKDQTHERIRCDSSIDFRTNPNPASGPSPLQVTYIADIRALNTKGITAVAIDFERDGFLDITYENETTPQSSFLYTVTYHSPGEFQHDFYFFWTENEEKRCASVKSVKVHVTYLCPEPSIQMRRRLIDIARRSIVTWVQSTNMYLNQVTFYAGYESLQKVECTPDNVLQNTCFFVVSVPDFGDWSVCWLAQSFCGARTKEQCETFVIPYPLEDLFQYSVGKAVAFASLRSRMAVATPPYISLLSPDGDVLKRLPETFGQIRWLEITEEGIWTLKIDDKFRLSFSDFDGRVTENVINPDSMYGTISFEIHRTPTKRYAILMRMFQEVGEILIFDISFLDSSVPICKRNIPPRAVIMEFIENTIFVGYLDKIIALRVNFRGEICEIENQTEHALAHVPSIFDIEGNPSDVVASYSSDFAKGKVFVFGYNLTSKTFFEIGSVESSVDSTKITSLKVSPFDLSRIAISYENSLKEHRTKIYDFRAGQSIGGIEGFKISGKAEFSTFLDELTVAIIDDRNNINILNFTGSRMTKSIGGFRNTHLKTTQIIDVDCNRGKSRIILPDGGGIAELDLSKILSLRSQKGYPEISSYISGDALLIQRGVDDKIYGIFNHGGGIFLSDIDFSFSTALEISDIRSFSAGMTYFIVGGSSGVVFAKKNFSSAWKLASLDMLKKSLYRTPFFFLFSGNRIHILTDDLTEVLDMAMDCQDVAVSDDGSRLFCINSTGITEYSLSGNRLTAGPYRSFLLSIGNVHDSEYEDGHIFFISDVGTSKKVGAIRTRDLKITLLQDLPQDSEPISISAKKFCVPNEILVSVYGNFPNGGVARGWIVRTF